MKNQENIPKGFKQSAIGVIPVEWPLKKLGSIATKIGSGITPSGGEKKYKSNGRVFLRSQNIGWGELLLDDVAYIDDKTHLTFKSTEIIKDDVFLNITGASIGRSAIADERVVEGNVNQHVCIIRTNKTDIKPYYLNAFLLSTIGQRLIDSFQAGGNRQGLNFEQIRSFPIPLPKLSEQTAIANLLSTWDKSIQTLTKLIEQKQLRKKWLMQQLLTGKKRLRGFKEEWKSVRIKDVFNEINDINDGIAGHTIMTVSSKLGLISQEDKFDRVIAGESLKKYTQLKKFDFAYNKGNSKTYPMGCIFQLETIESALVPFVYICFSPTNKVNATFYKHWFFAHGLDRQLKQIISSGARGDGLLNVNTDDFFNIKIPFPLIEEQQKIASIMEKATEEIRLIQNKLEKLKKQKIGLMQILLTGKKRLK